MAFTYRGSVLQAGDAGANDLFGISASLSDDGLVLVVGATGWENGTTDAGGVYTFDWSGSAWVVRGSVLEASDAGVEDLFGASVAISGDGLVLAVGAPWWDGSDDDAGAVYIFDRSGSSWTQRGSVLQASDADVAFAFGAAVALSYDGAVLAVGSNTRTSTYSQQGGVYIYDYASGWTQRGSVITASDAAENDQFGSSVTLSSDGSILAVGAPYRLGASYHDGGVYIYDYSSGWTQRGSVLEAADADADFEFGRSVSLSADGSVLSVGAPNWNIDATWRGGVYIYDYNSGWTQRGSVLEASDAGAGDGYGSSVALSATADVLAIGAPYWDGASANTGGVYVYDGLAISTPTAPTELTVSELTSTPSAHTALTIYAEATPSAPATLAIVDDITAATAIADGTSIVWKLACTIDGTDVSGRLTGSASVDAEEGAARVASLQMIPESGAIDPLDYVGKPIVIDFVRIISGVEVPLRIFTGRIDTPSYDPATTILRLECVDDLQNRVSVLEREDLDELTGGRYSVYVQGEILDNWDYAKALMSTRAASLDADANGSLRVTDWDSADLFATLGAGDLLYKQCSLSLPQRSQIINQVTIDYAYRYSRLRQRYGTLGFSATRNEMNRAGYQYPVQSELEAAADATGWTQTLGVYYPAPVTIPHSTGGVVRPRQGAIDMAIMQMTQRHGQTVTESYTIMVQAPESITQNGTLPFKISGAAEDPFNYQAWEDDVTLAPLLTTTDETDYAPTVTRTDSDLAINTLLDQAKVKILSSHRNGSVTNTTALDTRIDLDKRLRVLTDDFDCEGKVQRAKHLLDINRGSALTEFTLALSGAGGTGIITPDTLEPPDPPAEQAATQDWSSELPALKVWVYGGSAYSSGAMGLLLNPLEYYTVEDVPIGGGEYETQSYANPLYVAGSYPVTGFRVRMPGVDSTDREPVVNESSQSFDIIVPSDTLSFTVP